MSQIGDLSNTNSSDHKNRASLIGQFSKTNYICLLSTSQEHSQ